MAYEFYATFPKAFQKAVCSGKKSVKNETKVISGKSFSPFTPHKTHSGNL